MHEIAMERLAVIITVYNRKDKTILCLENLFAQELPNNVSLEVYLTDDGSTDGTKESVTKLYPQVTIIHGKGDLFWNRGMWTAWKEAAKGNYDFYLWLNDDTFIYKDVIKRLVECSRNHSNSAIIVGATCAVGKSDIITYGGLIKGKTVKDISKEQTCDTFNGNIVLVPKKVFKVLGTNDPYYRHALGDHDYGLSAKEKGIESWIAKGIMGECDRHERPTVWMDPSQPFKKRWKNFMSPVGNNPFEFFYFKKKHFGILPACKSFVTNYIHFLFPSLWRESYQIGVKQ